MSNDKKDCSELSNNEHVKILSSWHCATENGLEKTLFFKEDSGEDVDPINLMSRETCIFLTKEAKDPNETVKEGCLITLQTAGNTVISNLSILSEARLIEVHGPCNEYFKTVKGEFLLKVEDTTVYCADIKINHPCNYVLLKLNGLSRENDLWLYGLLVRWKVSSSQLNHGQPNGIQYSPFNFEAVDRRLSDLGQDLSANAQQYKKILELCNLKSKDARGDIQAMKPSISTLVASMFQCSQIQRSPPRESASDQQSYLEVLLDQKLGQLEQKILAEIDKKIEEMEERQQAFINTSFEKIMRQLQLNCNSSEVKPSTSTVD